jgi:hypothetical protein
METEMKYIELKDHEKTVAVLRELAGVRTAVPSSRDFPAAELDRLRHRVRELAQAIVDGGTMERSAGSLAASERGRTDRLRPSAIPVPALADLAPRTARRRPV